MAKISVIYIPRLPLPDRAVPGSAFYFAAEVAAADSAGVLMVLGAGFADGQAALLFDAADQAKTVGGEVRHAPG